MLHRLTLRVLPQLNALVTEPSVRKRKRLVMLAPGLIAFLIYRVAKHFLPLTDPFVLLVFSGGLSSVAALWAYRMGRGMRISSLIREDGKRRIAWVVGWVGFGYGVQLSLLVLALLKIFVAYDFLLHPEGPAMMAIIIACTSVTRDAFEIGVVRQMEQWGQKMLTFPDGGLLRKWVQFEPLTLGRWVGSAALIGVIGSLALGFSVEIGETQLAQTLLVSVVVSCVALVAFLSSESQSGDWWERAKGLGWFQSLRFWIWPCFTFAATYYLVQVGVVDFLIATKMSDILVHASIAGTTAGMMAGYFVYLGRRKLFEGQTQQGFSENLQNCPFVMGILSKAGVFPDKSQVTSAQIVSAQPEKAGRGS